MPAPIVLSTLTPEVKKVANPPSGQPVIATKAELRDGSRPTSGGGGGSDPAATGVLFSENFDDQPDYTTTQYSTLNLQESSQGITTPNNWDIVYQSTAWSPETGFPNNHASFEILAADSADARGGTGKGMKHYRESSNVYTITEADGATALDSDWTHIRIWQTTSPDFNSTKTSVVTVNGTQYTFSTTTGSDGDTFPDTALSLSDNTLGAVDAQFNNLTGQRPAYGVFSNAITVPAGATVTVTNGDIQGYDGSGWDEWAKKWGSDSQMIRYPIDRNNPNGTDELYVEFWIKFSENWYQRGFYESGWASKIFRVAHVTPGGNAVSGFGGDMGPIFVWDYKSDNFGIRNVHTFRGGPPGNLIAPENNYKTDELFGRFNGSRNFTTSIVGMGVGGTDPQLPDLVNGGLTVNQAGNIYHESVYGPPEKWTKMAFYFKMNSAAGVEDGVFKQWVDGHRVTYYPDCAWCGPNENNLMVKWNHLSFGGNDNFHPFPGTDRFEDWYMIDDIIVRDSLPEGLE